MVDKNSVCIHFRFYAVYYSNLSTEGGNELNTCLSNALLSDLQEILLEIYIKGV